MNKLKKYALLLIVCINIPSAFAYMKAQCTTSTSATPYTCCPVDVGDYLPYLPILADGFRFLWQNDGDNPSKYCQHGNPSFVLMNACDGNTSVNGVGMSIEQVCARQGGKVTFPQ